MTTETPAAPSFRAQRWGLICGLALFSLALATPAPAGLPPAGWHVLGLTLLMAIWWTTEPVPIAVTALLPIIVMPLLGIVPLAQAATAYADPLVFLFLAGFLMAAAVKRWDLHRVLALAVIRTIGTSPRRLILGFMLGCAFLSMWLSNTATVVLLLPVALSIVATVEQQSGRCTGTRAFSVALLLGLAYAASIGGVGTLIGSPPNALLAAYLGEQHGIDVSFAAWLSIGLPMVAIFLPLGWLVLTRVAFKVPAVLPLTTAAPNSPSDSLTLLGKREPMTPAQRRVTTVLMAAALCWMLRPLLNRLPGLEALSDPAIGLACCVALFLLPGGPGQRGRLMEWSDTVDLPWNVLLLFGGGLSLAAAMDHSGLADWIGHSMANLGTLPALAVLLLLAAAMVALSEVASNTAAVAALLPVAATVSASTGIDLRSITVVIVLACSCAFMLPMGTPPNALVFASGHVTAAAMMRAGLLMNLISVVLSAVIAWQLGPLLGGGVGGAK